MVLLTLVAAVLVMQADSGKEMAERIIPLQMEFRTCLATQTVALGAANAESAETLFRAAAARCRPVELQLVALYGRLFLPPAHSARLIERDRRLGEDAGVAALLEERAKLALSRQQNSNGIANGGR